MVGEKLQSTDCQCRGNTDGGYVSQSHVIPVQVGRLFEVSNNATKRNNSALDRKENEQVEH